MALVAAIVVALLPAALVLVLFSQVSPLAPAVIDALLENKTPTYGFALAGATALSVVVLRWLKKGEDACSWLLTLVLATTSAVLLFPASPVMVPAVLVLTTPAFLQALAKPASEEPRIWFKTARTALLLPAVGSLSAWIWFIASRLSELDKWTDWTQDFRQRVIDGEVTWKLAFVEWSSLLGISAELFLLALLYELQSRLADRQQKSQQQSGEDPLSVDDLYIISKVKMLGVLITIAAMVLWIGASLDTIGGDEEDLNSPRADMRNEALSLGFWVFAGLAVWLVYNLGGPEKVRRAANNSKVAERVLEMMRSEWARAGYLCCFAPFLLIYAILVRICPGSSDDHQEAELRSPMSQEAADDAAEDASPGGSMSRFNRLHAAKFYGDKFMNYLWTTPVVTKAQLLAIFYVSCAVGVKVITLSLAYTNALLRSLDVYVVSTAIFLIGTFLFLLPPTPGPPVYALVGILVTASATNSGWSVGWAMAWAVGVGFAIKMVFAAVAQKFIGEPMAGSPAIRNLVQMHTAEIRAIAKILQEPGISAAKVSILIGGPDWPVAVLCGMLKLNLCPIMLSLSPVLFQSVVPCVLSGSFLVLYSGDESKKALGESALALAGALQMVALLLAGYYIQDTLEKYYDELSEPRLEDKEAIELEEDAATAAKRYQEETRFETLPCHMKFVLVLGVFCGIVSCIVLAGPWNVLIGHTAFKKFEVTSDIDKVIGNNVLSIVLPLGWIAIFFCSVNAVCLQTFNCWADSITEGYEEVADTPGSSS